MIGQENYAPRVCVLKSHGRGAYRHMTIKKLGQGKKKIGHDLHSFKRGVSRSLCMCLCASSNTLFALAHVCFSVGQAYSTSVKNVPWGEHFLLSRPELRRSCTITICTGAIQDSNLIYVSYISATQTIYVVKL